MWINICHTTMLTYKTELSRIVEIKFQNSYPDSFSAVAAGWYVEPTHYVNGCATYPSQLLIGYDKNTLGLAPIEEVLSQSVQEHVDFFDFVL